MKGIYGGHVRAIAINPLRTQTIYAGLKGGGVYKSTDAAESWFLSSNGLGNYNVLSLEIDPTDTNLVYAGTEKGLYRSTNAGKNWKRIFLDEDQVNDILIDSSSQIIYIAVGKLYGEDNSQKKLFWSEDNGNTWQQHTFYHNNQPVDVYTIVGVYYDGDGPTTQDSLSLFVGTSNGIWISKNGKEWPDSFHKNDIWGAEVHDLAIYQKEPQYVYAGLNRGVIYSTWYGERRNPQDVEDSWQQQDSTLSSHQITCLAIDPLNLYAGTKENGIFKTDAMMAQKQTEWSQLSIDAEFIYEIIINPHNNDTLYAATSIGLYKSTDSGETWFPKNVGISCVKINQLLITHDQSLKFIAATEFGVFSSRDDFNWLTVADLPTTTALALSEYFVDNKNYLLVGFKDLNQIYKFDFEDNNWTQLPLDEKCDINTFTSFTAHNSQSFKSYAGGSSGVYEIVSNTCIKRWSGIGKVISLLVKNIDPDTLYAGTETNGLWSLIDANQKRISDGLSFDLNIPVLTRTGENGDTLFAGTRKGLYWSTDPEKMWEKITDLHLKNNSIKSFYVSSIDSIPAIGVVRDDGVIRSYDLFGKWDELNNGRGGLEDLFQSVVRHPDTVRTFYATTNEGQMLQLQARPEIKITPDKINFGKKRIKNKHDAKIEIQNTGEWQLTISKIEYEDDSLKDIFQIEFIEPIIILPGVTKTLTIHFIPQGRRIYSTKVNFISNAINKKLGTIDLTGQGIAPVIEIEPDTFDFNEVAVGDKPQFKDGTMINTGDDTFRFKTQLRYPDLSYWMIPDSFDLKPTDNLKFQIWFDPNTAKEYNNILIAKDQNYFEGDSIISLHGIGVNGSIIRVKPQIVKFKPVIPAVPDSQTFKIYNVGDQQVTINSLIISPNPPFSILSPDITDFPQDINVGDSLEAKIQFLSQTVLGYAGEVHIVSEATGDSIVALVAQSVTGPIIDISPEIVQFDTVYMSNSKTCSVFVKNRGDSDLSIDSVKYDSPLGISVVPPNAYPVVILPESTEIFVVAWLPDTTMLLNSNIIFFSNAVAGNDSIPITGISVAPIFDWPELVDFDSVLNKTTVTRDYNIRFVGGNNTLWFQIKKSGPDLDAFIIACDTSVEVNDSLSVKIVFEPREYGKHWAWLDIEGNTPFYGNKHVELKGRSILQPIMVIDPPHYDFHQVVVRDLRDKEFFIHNFGEDTLVIQTQIWDPGKYEKIYLVNDYKKIIPPGDSTQLIVTFKPDSIGLFPCILTFKTISVIGDQTLALNGEGIGPIPGIDLTSPTISFQWENLDSLHRGDPANIKVIATDTSSGIKSVILKFRQGGENSFIRKITLERQVYDTTQFLGNIPGDFITMQGFEYYIEATDRAGNRATHPEKFYHSARVFVNKDERESKPDPQPYGSMENSYRMISFPFKFYPDDAKSIMQYIVGEEYNSCRWKFAEYCGNEEDDKQYIFLDDPAISPIIPGKGFWLLISHKSVTLRTDSTLAITLYSNRPYLIELKKGWNIFSNPFNFPVSLSQIIWKGNESVEVRSYHDAWNQNLYDHVTEILPWEGYAIKTQEQDTLHIYPSPELVPAGEKTIMFQPSMDWAVQLIAKCGKAMDADNWIGVSASSQAGYDRMDISEPPPVGQFVSISFPHWDWQNRSDNYSTDFRPQFSEGDFWDFQVTSNIPDSVINIYFEHINKIPSQFKLYLIDKDLKNVQEITHQSKYSFVARTGATNRNFRAIIGNDTFFEQSNLGVKQLPLAYKLFDIFPNPFNSNASIYFTLPEDNEVTIEIFNILGQRVKTLLKNKFLTTGHHVMIWDGNDNFQNTLSNGLYLCQMKCDKYERVVKMILIK